MNANEAVVGVWHCNVMEQYASAGHLEEDRQSIADAAQTEFANAEVEFAADGTYELRGVASYYESRGKWTLIGGQLGATQNPAQVNGFEGLDSVDFTGEEVSVSFRLPSDAHDGLDILELRFGRERAEAPEDALAGDGVVPRLQACAEVREMYDVATSSGLHTDEVLTEVMEALVEGKWMSPGTDGYAAQSDFLMELFLDVMCPRDFNHDHALALLQRVDPGSQPRLADHIVMLLEEELPEGPRDAELTPKLTAEWLELFETDRFSL